MDSSAVNHSLTEGRRLLAFLDPRPWLVVSVVMNISAISDGFPTAISAESLVGVGVVLTTILAHLTRSKQSTDARPSLVLTKAALLIPLLLTVSPLLSQLAASGDLQVVDHSGYRHFVKFLVVVTCWASLLRTRRDRSLILNTLFLSYAMLAVVALFRFLVLREVNPDTGRMELLFRHGDPNFLCVYMGTGTMLALWRLMEARESAMDRVMSVVAPLAVPLFLVTAWFTASRSGVFTLAVILFAAAVLLPKNPRRAAPGRFAAWAPTRFSRAILLVVAMAGVLAVDGDRILRRLDFRHDASALGRISSVEAGWLGLTRNPALGLGFKKSTSLMQEVGASSKFVTVDGGLTIHNTFLQIGAELGMIGMIVYAFALLLVARAIAREWAAGSRRTAFLLGVWTFMLLFSMSALPMAYDVTLLGTLLLIFAVLPPPRPLVTFEA